MHDLLIGALSWDPQIRGLLIVVTAVAILPGSIYLLLSTNMGARIGFLLAVAGLSGWLMLLAITWALYGQGIKGRDPSWKVQEVVHSAAPTDLSEGALPVLREFPNGWNKLEAGNSALADAQAAADAFITKSGRKPKIGPEGPIKKEPTAAQLRYPAEFSQTDEYALVGGYEKGGRNCLGPKASCDTVLPKKILFWKIHHKFFLRHSPHYVTVQIQPLIPNPPDARGEITYSKELDTTKPITAVIVKRDLGSTRFPQVMMALGAGIIFAVTCHALHRRDKQIMALRAAGTAPAMA
jgi:hypothetical protein